MERERYRPPFHFLDAWTRDFTCKLVIEEAWRIAVRGFRSFQLVVKMNNTKKALKKWNKENFGFCQDKLRILNDLFLEVQTRILSQANIALEADIQLEIMEIWNRQESIWKQKSREQ
ncbi:hypothetical protein TorRG33x02_016640 [Trema orientale]|uniref:Uncharacterized protein n=1 Tax=Trema orientale TaxID=63057 RepID=A0A2P5FY05_TREOI|nr:hypothetical protein TorRG33x02_016640 [Trema orientale]